MSEKGIPMSSDIIDIILTNTSPDDILEKFDELYEKAESEYEEYCFELIFMECFKRNVGFVEYIVRAEGHKRRTGRLLIIALCCAIGEKNDHIIQLILSRNAKTCDAVPYLGLFTQPKTLIHKFNDTILFENYYDPIGAAVCTDNVAILQTLLRTYDTQTFGREGKNSLFRYAVSEYYGSRCREYILYNAKGDINLPDVGGHTPLMVAARCQPWLIPKMLEMGADVNYTKPNTSITYNALYLLSTNKQMTSYHGMDYVSLAQILIQAGICLNKAVQALCILIHVKLKKYVDNINELNEDNRLLHLHMKHIGNDLRECFKCICEVSSDHDIMEGLRLVILEIGSKPLCSVLFRRHICDIRSYITMEIEKIQYIRDITYIFLCNLKRVDNLAMNSILESVLLRLVDNHRIVCIKNPLNYPLDYSVIFDEIRKLISLIKMTPKFRLMQNPTTFIELLYIDKGFLSQIFDCCLLHLPFIESNNLINDLVKVVEDSEPNKKTFLVPLLLDRLKEIDTLMKMCRGVIIQCLSSIHLCDKVELLPLPDLLKTYVANF